VNRRSLRLSARLGDDEPNGLAAAKQRVEAKGIVVTDLTNSNPTRHGLTDPAIMDVLAQHLGRASVYTPDPKGWLPARETLADRFGGGPDDYWLTASTSEAYSWLFAALADPDDALAVPVPGYPLIEPLARLTAVNQLPYRSVYLHPSGWEFDLDSVGVALASPGIRALVAVNPNNPTGAYVHPDTAAALGMFCAKTGVPIIADEVFFPYALERREQHGLFDNDNVPPSRTTHQSRDEAGSQYHRRLAETAGPDTVVITLDGLSKLLAAPQLKLGWIRLSGPRMLTAPLARTLDAIADTFLSVNSIVACALPELLDLADGTVARVRQRCLINLLALEGLGDSYRVRRIEGGWTVLVDVPPVMEDDQLSQALLDAGLSAHPGWFYDVADAHVLALSLLPEAEAFADGLTRLQDVINR